MSEISATTTRARSGSGLRGRFDAVMERFGSQAIVYVIFLGIIAFFAVYAPSFATGSSLANIGRQTAAITTLAGLDVERIVNEPTAAAIAFAHGRKLEERVIQPALAGRYAVPMAIDLPPRSRRRRSRSSASRAPRFTKILRSKSRQSSSSMNSCV